MIRGFFDVSYPVAIPKVWIGLILPHRLSRYIPIDFVVDTGAAATCLHPADAIYRAGFTDDAFDGLRDIARTEDALTGITGNALYSAVPARYLFAHEDGALQSIDGEIRIARPTAGNMGIPSIMGWDLLQYFRIVVDRRSGEVQLQ